MDSFKTKWCLLLLICLTVFIGSGCTKKNNLTGNNWSDTHRLTADDKTGIVMGYSFPAETLSQIKGTETKLLVANYRSATAKAYLRFTGLPDPDNITDLDSC